MARWEQFQSQARVVGFKPEFLMTSRAGEAETAAQSNAEKYDLLVAVGGDGTNLEVANGILASHAPATLLAVVPVGTGNDLAETLGIQNPAVALRSLVGGKMRPLDVIRVECLKSGAPVVRHALVFAAVGIAGEALNRTTAAVKRLLGCRLSYPYGLLRALWSWQPPVMRVTADGRVFEHRFLLVCASNGEQVGGGIRIAPGASMDDGLLNLNLIEAGRKSVAVRHLLLARRGKHVPHPKIRYFTASQVTVEADTPVFVAADGEVLGATPARIEIVPAGLNVWL
jgi:YegS/Rv2252/BmrU family lipid kinase